MEVKYTRKRKRVTMALTKTKKMSDLVRAVQEMAAYHRGEISLKTRTLHVPTDIDVASIRKNFGFTQKQFADHYGFKLSALKEWEQGRRRPERSARILLKVIALAPKVVERVLTEKL
jgi:putative transcriptional regulator